MNPALRLAVSGLLLAAVAVALRDAPWRDLWRLPHPGWLALALLLALPQWLLSAQRWRLSAARLGAPLPLARAVTEYARATFLNMVLPGGVAGDALRAVRHARVQPARAAAWQAVVADRMSGQAALLLFALAGLVAMPALGERLSYALLAVLTVLGLVALWASRFSASVRRHGLALRTALVADGVWRQQLALSLVIVASYVAVWLCCARMLGLDTPASVLWPLATWALLAMSLPVGAGGWGVREGAAALLWPVAGLPASEGVALSVAYGLVVLLSSLPGALWLGGLSTRSNSVSSPQR